MKHRPLRKRKRKKKKEKKKKKETRGNTPTFPITGQQSHLVGRSQATAPWPQLLRCHTPGGPPGQPGRRRQLSLLRVQSYTGHKGRVSKGSTLLITHGQACCHCTHGPTPPPTASFRVIVL